MKMIFAPTEAHQNNQPVLPRISPQPCQSLTRIRLRLLIPQYHRQNPVISHLVSEYGLVVNISRAVLEDNQHPGQFDLELTGTIAQLKAGLGYLASVDVMIRGKANPDGDGWYC